MSAGAARLGRRLAGFAIYAYRTLVLYFFVMSALRFLLREAGWINEFVVFLILSSVFATAPACHRLRGKQEGPG